MCDQHLHVLAVLPSVKVFIIADNWFEMKWLSCFFSSACNVCAISPDSLALSAGHVTEMSASPSGFAGKGFSQCWKIQALLLEVAKLCGKYRLMNKVPNCVTKVTFLLTVMCVALMYWLTEHKKNKLLTYLPWCMLPWYNCIGWPGIKNNLFTLKCVALCVDRA